MTQERYIDLIKQNLIDDVLERLLKEVTALYTIDELPELRSLRNDLIITSGSNTYITNEVLLGKDVTTELNRLRNTAYSFVNRYFDIRKKFNV